MNLTVTEWITNWLDIREEVSHFRVQKAQPHDYHKVRILLFNSGALNGDTYEVWSKKFNENHALPTSGPAYSIAHEKINVRWILEAEILTDIANGDFERIYSLDDCDEYEGEGSENMLIRNALSEHLDLLEQLPTKFIFSVLGDKSRSIENGYNKELRLDITDELKIFVLECFEHLELLPQAVEKVFKGDSKLLFGLLLDTFYMQNRARQLLKSPPIGLQQKQAALKRHESGNKTKEYAISLYKEKEWPSVRQASINILQRVRDYGKTVGFHFTTDFQAQERIGIWLRAYKKNRGKN